jgi:hypothetical protein
MLTTTRQSRIPVVLPDTTPAREQSQQKQQKLVHVVLLLVALLPGKYSSRLSPLLGAFLAGLRRHDSV